MMNQSTKATLAKHILRAGIALASLLLGAEALTACSGAEGQASEDALSGTLYVGDVSQTAFAMFDSATGAPQGLVKSKAGLSSPMGMVPALGGILISNLHANTGVTGDLLVFSTAGTPLYEFVHNSDKNAPLNPRGIVVSRGIVYVADITLQEGPKKPPANGLVRAYKSDGSVYCTMAPPANLQHGFYPRGIVIGPDGFLYVANVPTGPTTNPTPSGGDVFRFDPATCVYHDTFVSDAGGIGQLNRPDGLVFAPDGKLYVSSFRANASDNDTIRIYNSNGVYLGNIPLDQVGGVRSYAQALLFGPGGDLFVPISGGGPDGGSVRRYNVTNKTFTNFVNPGGLLDQGWYLTFDKTNPATLAYEP